MSMPRVETKRLRQTADRTEEKREESDFLFMSRFSESEKIWCEKKTSRASFFKSRATFSKQIFSSTLLYKPH